MDVIDAAALLETMPDPVIVADADGRILALNPALERVLGWRSAELEGQPLSAVLSRHTPGRVEAMRKGGARIEVDLAFSRKGPLQIAVLRQVLEEQVPAGVEWERYRLLFENAPVGILHFDARGMLTAANDAVAEMLQTPRSSLLGINLLTLQGESGREAVAQLCAEALQGKRTHYDGPYASMMTGKVIEISATVAPIHGPSGEVEAGMIIAADVSERKRMEARLARADRMASIGTLAAGVAHEINNPLVYVTLGLELIERELSRMEQVAGPEDWARLRSICADAITGAERVRTIVRDLRIFSRPGEEKPVLVDVEKVLESSINMAMSHIRPRARVERDYHGLQPVLADESRLGQVFLNLLVNAAQAIPEGAAEQHRIVLRTRAGEHGEAIIEVEDTGIGMEKWKLERIFEPFWTDKPVGVGTGLGLSIVHGIVAGMGGEIVVRSELARGSTFRVTLPVRPAPLMAAEARPTPPSVPRARRPRMLLIDDEPHLGVTLATGLRAQSDVVSVHSGREGIQLLLEDGKFDLILCDLMMPDLTGMDVFEQVMQKRPELRSRFVFTTGGAVTERARKFIEAAPRQRLDKPFRLEQVEELLRLRG